MRLVSLANKIAKPFGLKVVPASGDLLHYQHGYNGGYAEYRKTQIFHNHRKLDRVFADERTLETIARFIEGAETGPLKGLCHGARNGWEVKWFKDRLHCEVIGTDISETANTMPDMVQHDFHDVREDWLGQFSFIYTNSLDQAFDPAKALDAWAGQLKNNGLIFIEHTMLHSAAGASEMDPFGAHPMVMPYLLFDWGRGKYDLHDILKLKVPSLKGDVWIFVLRRA